MKNNSYKVFLLSRLFAHLSRYPIGGYLFSMTDLDKININQLIDSAHEYDPIEREKAMMYMLKMILDRLVAVEQRLKVCEGGVIQLLKKPETD